MKYERPKIIVIVGPTASGKTSLSIDLAKKIKGEIISADSRQVYKGLDIGTGKVTKKEMTGIPHHLLDVVNPKRRFSVADFKKLTDKKIKEIIAKEKTPIIVGGTGFYIQAVIDDLILPEVPPNQELRKKLAKKSNQELLILLKKMDPRRAKEIDSQNPVRLIRAIEIAKAIGGVPKLKSKKKSNNDFKIIGIKIDQKKLDEKIHNRLNSRLRQGMIAEVKRLHTCGLSWKRMEELGLEYRYIALFLQKKITKTEMTEQLEREIIKYSKRQMTWFKRDKRISWLSLDNQLIPNALKIIESNQLD